MTPKLAMLDVAFQPCCACCCRGACMFKEGSDAANAIKLVHFAYYYHHNHTSKAQIG